jgi:NTE family protein
MMATAKSNEGRPRVGLALSGGAARITAHVGVLSVLLQEPGLTIDYVTGTSAGSVVGAAFCAGIPLGELKALAREVSWGIVASPKRTRHGLFCFARMEYRMMCLMGDIWFSELDTPLAVMATDLETSEPVVLREGRVVEAVRASCSVPGLFEPVRWRGRYLVDGGIADNLPAEVARQMGADYVIGVDLFAPHWPRQLGPLGAGIMALQTLIRRAGGGLDQVDHLIAPDLYGAPFVRFHRREELIELGRQAAEASLPQIRADLGL